MRSILCVAAILLAVGCASDSVVDEPSGAPRLEDPEFSPDGLSPNRFLHEQRFGTYRLYGNGGVSGLRRGQ